MRSLWRQEEDDLLRTLVENNRTRDWNFISKSFPGRSKHSCRLRWANHLSSEVAFSPEEDEMIIQAHAQVGDSWGTISRLLKRRTNIEIKNHWTTTLKRKCRAFTPRGKSCDSSGNEGFLGGLEDEQPLKRMASGVDVSTRLCLSLGSGPHVFKRSTYRSDVEAEVTALSSGGDLSTCLSLSIPSQVNESTQLDLNMAIDNEEEEEEEEEEAKRIRTWV